MQPVADQRPTIGERYCAAVSNGASSADVIVAAGMQDRALGALLWRLQTEYDSVRGDLELAGEISRAGDAEVKRLARLGDVARKQGARLQGDAAAAAMSDAAARDIQAEGQRKRTDIEVLTARCLILTHLRTLDPVKRQVAAYAIQAAARRRYPRPNDVVARLAHRVLDVWLDPTCHKCDGTGWVGSGYLGEVATVCRACNNTGSRRDQLGNDEQSRWFAFLLLGDLQREMSEAAKRMAARLRPA